MSAESILVDDWMKRAGAPPSSPKSLLTLFQQGLEAVWRRALPVLGDVTLNAIAVRTVKRAAEAHPVLSVLKPGRAGISFEALEREAEGLKQEELEKALPFLLIEFLSVLTRLTSGILDEDLREALVQAAPDRPALAEKREPALHETPAEEEEPTMTTDLPLIETGVRNLDAILGGGLPRGTVCAVEGAPGSGKTILAQQIIFHNASPKSPAIIFNTLSEPAAKTLAHLNRFSYFERKSFGKYVHFVDLGAPLRKEGLAAATKELLAQVERIKPGLVVIDSFKTFVEIAKSPDEFRKFIYDLGVNLMAWECTSLLVGEYAANESATNPLLSMVDGQVVLSQRVSEGEEQRFVQVRKMRGIHHSTDEHTFSISERGIEVYAPRVTIKRKAHRESAERIKTGVAGLDELLAGGVTRGSTMLIGGTAGTGKTVLLLEFIYRGAQAGQKGLFISFEETEERLREAARTLGFAIDELIENGLIKIFFIPQPDVRVERDLLFMKEVIEAGVERVAIDSISVFLHKVERPQIAREKIFQLATLVQNAQAIAFFSTDIPYGSSHMSRFGVEETVLDGVMRLSSTEEGMERERYIEAYKLRTTAHLMGRHAFVIGKEGLRIFPRHEAEPIVAAPPPAMASSKRLSTGVPGLDEIIGGGLLQRSQTLVSGSSGTGKSTLAFQFVLEGAKHREKGLFVTLGEGPDQIVKNIAAIGLPVDDAIKKGLLEILYLSPEEIRAGQFLSILTQRVKKMGATRLVFDSMSNVVTAGLKHVPLGDLLYNFAFRFKTLGVTSMVTVESRSSYSEDPITEMDFSPVADNIILIRYHRTPAKVEPALRILKTRGSAHDKGIYFCPVTKNGMSIGPRVEDGDRRAPAEHRPGGRRHARR